MKRVFRYFSFALLGLLGVVIYVAVFGIHLDFSPLRTQAAAALSHQLGRSVYLDGAVQLELSARPKFLLTNLRIANAAGFAGGDLLSLGEVRLSLNLWPLLRLQFKVEELSGSQIHLNLQQTAQGNNWTFNLPTSKPAEALPSHAPPDVAALLSRLSINHIALENIQVEFSNTPQAHHYFELQTLEAHFPAGQALTLHLQGAVEKTLPYQLDFTGGTLANLGRLQQPWPVNLTLDLLNSRLSIAGNLAQQSGDFTFAVGSTDVGEFAKLLQIQLPAVGACSLSGKLSYQPNQLALHDLHGAMGNSVLHGQLEWTNQAGRPHLQGELDLPTLDLRPFMSNQASTQNAPAPQGLSALYQELAQATFDLSQLNQIDSNLTLRIGHWLNLPGDIHNAELKILLAHGKLTMPLQITIAKVQLNGQINADASLATPRFHLNLGTQHSPLGNLAGVFFNLPNVRGNLQRFDFRLNAQGKRGAELMSSLDTRLEMANAELSYGNGAGERPVNFSLAKLLLAVPAGKPLSGELRGELLNKPFSATLHGGALRDSLHGNIAPIDFVLQAGSAHAELHAIFPAKTETAAAAALTFDLAAPHSGELATWLGLKPTADAPIHLHGVFQASDAQHWHLADMGLQLGHSDLTLDIAQQDIQSNPLIKLKLVAKNLDIDELLSLQPATNTAANTPVESNHLVNMIDIPILPTRISLADADIEILLQHFASRSPIALENIKFDGQIRNGMMNPAPFSARVAEQYFAGALLLDFRSEQPHSELWLYSDGWNIGNLLNKLNISKTIQAGFGHVGLHLDLHASHLGQLLAHSELTADFDGGYLALSDANTGKTMRIELENGTLSSMPGEPIRLDLLGSLDDKPISIGIQSAKAVDLLAPNLAIPFKLYASTSGAALQLEGDIDRPFSQQDIELALNVSGSRLDNLNTLARTKLPPWGPWSAAGNFHLTTAGYEISALQLQIGSSQLSGHGKLNTQLEPARLEVTLNAPSIQLDDFKLGDWSPEKATPAASAPKNELPDEISQASNQAQQLLSPEVMQRQNAYLTVRVAQVVSGADLLGSGKLDATLENGRLDIGALVNTPGGNASMQLGYQPTAQAVAVNFRAEAQHFDYGILARRLDAKSEMRGTLSLDVDVNGHPARLSELFRVGEGKVNFAIWPQNLKSGLLDIWAVNALMALLPAIDSANESKVNCAIAQFSLQNGLLTDKSILIDTSRMRVNGTGKVDFKREDILLYVQPHAKTPQFLSLAIPVELTGNFNDFHVGVRASDVLGTMGQLSTSLLAVPLEMLFGKVVPADGSDVCLNSSTPSPRQP